jgi:hypothetical protein
MRRIWSITQTPFISLQFDTEASLKQNRDCVLVFSLA